MGMRYGQKKNPMIFGGGQRSQGVIGGQNLKPSLTQYLKLGNLYQVYTWCVGVLWWKEEPCCFWWRSKVKWGYQR